MQSTNFAIFCVAQQSGVELLFVLAQAMHKVIADDAVSLSDNWLGGGK